MKMIISMIFYSQFLFADVFFADIFNEVKMLNLTREQEKQIQEIFELHHKYLKNFHVEIRNNYGEIIDSFANSNLNNRDDLFKTKEYLKSRKIHEDKVFLLKVYSILNANQRKTLGETIRVNSTLRGRNESAKNIIN